MPYIILTVIISIGVAFFAIQNAVSVPLNFFVWNGVASLVLVILGSFLCGVLVATLYLLVVKTRHYLQDKKLREEIETLQKDKKVLEERIRMLMHTQMLHEEATKTSAEKSSADGAEATAGK